MDCRVFWPLSVAHSRLFKFHLHPYFQNLPGQTVNVIGLQMDLHFILKLILVLLGIQVPPSGLEYPHLNLH